MRTNFRSTTATLLTLIICSILITIPSQTRAQNNNDEPQPINPKTNIVIIFIDDQGYQDLGCFGATGFTTPHIDNLATQGVRFTNFYVSEPVCSASRASLLTGCYAKRVGIRGALMPWATHGLDPAEETIADILKTQNYATAAIGKWHLGHQKPFLPLQQGFDEYLGIPYSNDMWPVHFDGTPLNEDNAGNRKWKLRYPQLPLIEDNELAAEIRTLQDQDTITTRYTERAVDFINRQKDSANPFFLYLAHSMPHVPLGVSDKFKGKSEQGMYGDVIMEIDWSVGQVLNALEQNNFTKNTLVIYTSDNGPWLNFGNHAGTTGPLREGKGTTWEGGVRVPCVIRWPGQIPANTTSDKLAATIDLLPTIAAITGAPLPEKKIDGVNILPLLLQTNPDAPSPRDHMVFFYSNQPECIRQGDWKLQVPHGYRTYVGHEPGQDGFPGPTGRGQTTIELYNLKTDIGEQNNLADEYPEIVNRMLKLIEHYRETLGQGNKEPGTEVRPAAEFKG